MWLELDEIPAEVKFGYISCSCIHLQATGAGYIIFMPGVGAVLEPIQDLPVRRIGWDFYVLQGKKPQEYLLYCKVF